MSTYGSNKRGGASKKMKKYPRILDFLQAHHDAVYSLFDDAGMHGSLTPRRGGSVTFLMPDAALTKTIRSTLEGANPEDATDMLSALILTDMYNTTADFASASDNVGTILGKKLPIDKVSGQEVVLANGAKLTKNKSFVPFERQGSASRGNMAVWDYKGKMWDYKKAAEAGPSTEGGKSHRRRRKRGGFMMTRAGDREALITSVENEMVNFWRDMGGDWRSISRSDKNPYLRAAACVMAYLRDNDPDELCRVMPFVCSPSRATNFYALVDSPLLNDMVITACREWNKDAYNLATLDHCMKIYMDHCKDDKAMLSSVEGQKKFYAALKKLIKRTPKSDFIYKKEAKYLNDLTSSNKLEGFGGKVLPELSYQAVRTNDKLFHLVNMGAYDIPLLLADCDSEAALRDAFKVINDRYNDPASYNALLAAEQVYASTAKSLKNTAWLDFAKQRVVKGLLSTLPMSREAGARYSGADEPSDVVDIKAEASQLSGANEVSLSAAATNELREYIRTMGGLPEEFADAPVEAEGAEEMGEDEGVVDM